MAKRNVKRKNRKGISYIARTLRKYYPSRYKNYSDALTRARELSVELSDAGLRVTVRNIKSLSKLSNDVVSKTIQISERLLVPSHYFDITDYSSLISLESDKILFSSKVSSPDLPPIKGGGVAEYQKYFKPFVDYMNKVQASYNDSVYHTELFVKVTTPVFNKKSKLYNCFIVSCDADGEENDYGFNPSDVNLSDLPNDLIVSDSGVPKIDKEPKKQTETLKNEGSDIKSDAVKLKELDVELEKEKTKQATVRLESMKTILELMKEGVLSKTEAKQLIAKL